MGASTRHSVEPISAQKGRACSLILMKAKPRITEFWNMGTVGSAGCDLPALPRKDSFK